MSNSEQIAQIAQIAQTTPLNTGSHITEKADADNGAQGVSKSSLIATIIAGITASACCIGPLVLLTLGISGSWISNFSVLEPLRPVFIGITAIFLGLAYRKLYLLPKICDADSACANPAYLRKQRIIFWIVTVAVIAIVAFPWYGVWLLDD